MITTAITIGVPLLVALLLTLWIFTLRRIVPTNVVHIVQRGGATISYGVGKPGGNVYYEFPSWVPIIGIIVRKLPVSNFDIDLHEYSAYDKDRVPFLLDARAFFHIADTNKAAEKVESFEQLSEQLENVVKGAVRSILAQHSLDDIMEKRGIFGQQFTESVNADLQQWGVEAIKNIELMDIKDSKESTVIKQIMAKRMSAIDAESRTEIALNKQKAEQAELESAQLIAIKDAETKQKIGEAQAASQQAVSVAKAESAKNSNIAEQSALKAIAEAKKETAEKELEVDKVTAIKGAEIAREKSIIDAESAKRQMEISAEADRLAAQQDAEAKKFAREKEAEAELIVKTKQAEGTKTLGIAEADIIKAKGEADAEAKKLMELAGVTAQTTLAKEIGENKEYQAYMIEIKKVEVSQAVGIAQAQSLAEAMKGADLKLLVNSGDVHSGMSKLSDIFTSKGGSQLTGMIEAFKQTEEGKAILSLLPGLSTTKDEKK